MTTSDFAGIKALIIEAESLIALEISEIMAQAGALTLQLRSFNEALQVQARWQDYRLAIVNPPDGSISEAEIALGLQDAGVRLVICSADSTFNHAASGLGAIPVVTKPFSAEDLLAACEIALAS